MSEPIATNYLRYHDCTGRLAPAMGYQPTPEELQRMEEREEQLRLKEYRFTVLALAERIYLSCTNFESSIEQAEKFIEKAKEYLNRE